jgi:uncharacterized membrane protein
VSVPEWLVTAPDTTNAVWGWFLAIVIVYTLVRKGIARFRGGIAPTNMARLSDAATFAGSVLLLIGIVHPATLKAIGDTTGFLIIGGTGGLFYAAEQLLGETGDGEGR